MIIRKDLKFLAGFGALLALAFAPLLLIPGQVVGNFGDVYAYHLPLRGLVASRLQEGALPFWNPYLFGGTPLLANPQAGLFYPLSALFAFWSAGTALNWSLPLHLLLAFFGMQLWLRRGGLKPSAAGVLASAYALSPFIVLRLAQGVPTLLYSLAFVPWTWLFLDRPALLAMALALQFLSGHPQFLAANGIALAAYVFLFRRDRAGGFLLGAAGSAALSLVQLWPTYEFLSRSVRVHWSSLFQTGYSLPWSALGTMLVPDVLGSPMDGSFKWGASVYFELFNLYCGAGLLALAAAGLWKGRRGVPTALMGLGLFMALGQNNPLYRFVSLLPPISWVRAPSRFSFIFLWGLFWAAAAGWSWAAERRPDWRWKAGVAALVLAELLLFDRRYLYRQDLASYMSPHPAVMAPMQAQPQYRMATAPDIANPNKCMLYRLRNASGYEAFYLAGAALYMSRSEGRPSADPSRVYISRIDNVGMEALAVRSLLTHEDASGRPAYRAEDLKIYENPGAYRLAFFESGAGADPVRTDPESWRVLYKTGLGGILVLSEAAYPGWRAWVDGREARLEPWRGFLQSLYVGPGTGVVHFRYRPRAWPFLLGATLAAWALLALRGLGLWEERA